MLSPAMKIDTEAEKTLTVAQELDLLRNAHAKSPNESVRARLAHMLLLDDQFDEVVALYEDSSGLGYREEMLLTQAYISQENAVSNARARDAAERALGQAQNDAQRAAALAARGKSERRLGAEQNARASFNLALSLDPTNKDACKRLAAMALEENRTDELLALTDTLMSKGAAHARLFGARVLAHAQAGDMQSAHEADGFSQLHRSEQLPPPPGWDSIEQFSEALAEELLAHPGMRYERYGSASELTWRIENPARPDTPLFKLLVAQIIQTLRSHVSAMADCGHPWADAQPENAFLRNWCVITESTGFENWHVHQFGWLSGVFYVRVPDSISQGSGRNGCLAFGLPEDLVGEQVSADFGKHLVRPKTGMLLTFPSHAYHRTYPHGSGEKRICVAFDLRPI